MQADAEERRMTPAPAEIATESLILPPQTESES